MKKTVSHQTVTITLFKYFHILSLKASNHNKTLITSGNCSFAEGYDRKCYFIFTRLKGDATDAICFVLYFKFIRSLHDTHIIIDIVIDLDIVIILY